MIKIDYLKNHPHYLRLVVGWVYDEWWKYRDDTTLRDVLSLYNQLLNKDSLPIGLIAFYENEPIGTVLICENNPDVNFPVSPWLEGLFVKEDFRKKGAGKELVKHIEIIAKQLGFTQIYLSTHIERYYSKLGWTDAGILESNDRLMKKIL